MFFVIGVMFIAAAILPPMLNYDSPDEWLANTSFMDWLKASTYARFGILLILFAIFRALVIHSPGGH